MGAYLSKPVTDKISSDESNENLDCGASSMQGWRIYQEDAHNAILNYDKNRSLFAVYDGHGGSEVAAYTAAELPDFIKKIEAYNNEQFSQALRDAFLEFDATLVEPEVLVILKDIAGSKDQDDSDYDGEEVDHLCREASMPLEEVMAKYSEDCINFQSPNIRPKKVGCSSSEGCSSLISELNESSDNPEINNSVDSTCSEENEDSGTIVKEGTSSSSNSSDSPSSHKGPHIEDSSSSLCNGEPEEHENVLSTSNHSNAVNGEKEPPHMNGNIKDEGGGKTSEENETELITEEKSTKLKSVDEKGTLESIKDSVSTKPLSDDLNNEEEKPKTVNGEICPSPDTPSRKGKGKAKSKGFLNNSLVQAMRIIQRRENKRKAAKKAEEIYKQIQGDGGDESNSDDDEDESFENVCTHDFGDNSSSEEEDSETNDDDDEDDDEEDSDSCEDDSQYNEYPMSMREEPGYDSGCTACVALINGNELYVANVGDSRCVVCRDGKAVDMSVDHKPEDEPEATRITKAGGRITNDGRVNGGLNLSRALGDHSYKQNKNQRAEEQMISPLPDVRSLTLTPEDSFMVIACDGIWNSMSSQEVCDFISTRLETNPKLSKIAEEMFDSCLSPDSHGDGTGCDNMTCIIVKFGELLINSECGGKRTCEKEDTVTADDPQEKRCRLEESK